MRPLAFIDLETTGLDPARHEILEIGVIVADPRTLEIRGMLDVRVRPGRIEDADPVALGISGWSAEAWKDAVPLDVALVRLKPLLDGALFAGHNVAFDRGFLDAAWRSTGVAPPEMDHHILDTATLAWPLLAVGLVESLSLDPVCRQLGIDLADPHRALPDARRSLEVARCLLPEAGLITRVRALEADERALIEMILGRIDALNYCAAELVRLGRVGKSAGMRTRRIYVCHPYSDDPEGNVARVREICRALTDSCYLPIVPHLYLPQFVDEKTGRELALSLCIELIGTCDEVRVYGGRVTAGMRREIEHAEARAIQVRFVDAEAER